ncbi:serine/threonine protein phosphatase [Rhodobacteraceae bacterium NNCM2]|nr:serine/threonine protein phosphatase [Coraliihabitans acroporae]
MLRLFGNRKPTRFDAPIEVERRIYAVGDIHGRLDLLTDLVDEIRSDARAYDGTPEIVFMGDYIDRGEDSRAVLDFLMALRADPAFDVTFLMGNHERMMLDFLLVPEMGARWLRFGGLQTLMSYGTSTHGSVNEPGALEKIQAGLIKALGPHRDFIEQMKLSHMSGNVLFAHAAANPGRPADGQSDDCLLWGHPKFFDQIRDDGVWVVHGHTVVDEPSAENGRIAVDTGAYFSNRLTAARLDGGEVVFLTA